MACPCELPLVAIVTVRPPLVRLLPLASTACNVIVEVVEPSASTVDGKGVVVGKRVDPGARRMITKKTSATAAPLIAAVIVTS